MIYGNTKAIWHRESMGALAAGRQPYPTHIELVISDHCNHDCHWCTYRMSGYSANELFQIDEGQSRKARNPKRRISLKKCVEILESCKEMDIKAIQFTGGGEPTIHPDFMTIAKTALEMGFDCALVTNGSMLTKYGMADLLRRFKWVRISIDTDNSFSYEEGRGLGSGQWDNLEVGVKYFSRMVDRSDTVLGAGFVVMPNNWHEVYSAVRMYKEWGFHNVRLGLMFSTEDEKPFVDIWDNVKGQCELAENHFNSDTFQVINRTQERFDEFSRNRDGEISYNKCMFQNFTNYVGGDLNVYRCCMWAYHPHGLMGNIKDQTLKELYDSAEKKKDFDEFDAKSCGKCQFNTINKSVNQWMEVGNPIPEGEEPFHVNFV